MNRPTKNIISLCKVESFFFVTGLGSGCVFIGCTFGFSGASLCVFNKEGQLRWATPNAWNLMKIFSDTNYEPSKKIVSRIVGWLNNHEGSKIPLDLSSLGVPLKFSLSRRTVEGESLLRIEEIKVYEEIDIVNTLRNNWGLTPREAEVLLWTARGKTNREIGYILNLSPRTVNKYLEIIFPKLAVDNRTSAANLVTMLLYDN